jgi:hypothetical protein
MGVKSIARITTNFMMGEIMFPQFSLPNERWLPVADTSQRYFISTMGRLLTTGWKGGNQTRIMKPALDARGYLRTMIKKDCGKTGTIKMHRLVAQAYLPNPNNLAEVNHKDGVKTNNAVENLEWMSHLQNVLHSFTIGVQSNKGSKNPIAKLTEDQVREIRATYVRKKGNRKIFAERYGVAEGTIKGVVLGKSWTHVK